MYTYVVFYHAAACLLRFKHVPRLAVYLLENELIENFL